MRTAVHRAARFNVEVRAPEKRLDLREEARKKKALERRGRDFVTGMDMFTEVCPDVPCPLLTHIAFKNRAV